MSRNEPRGQAMVEFVFIIPLMVGMILGFFDLGRVVLANDVVSNAAAEATRYAIVHGGSEPIPGVPNCPSGPPGTFTVVPPASPSCPYPSPSKEAIVQVAKGFAAAAGYAVTVEVCYGAGCSGDTNLPLATNERGTAVTVTVRSTVAMAAASIVGLATFDVSATSTMLVNH
jgi:hypothetical protein